MVLSSSDDEEIALYDWLAVSLAAQDDLISTRDATITARGTRISELESQLESLVEAKKKYEEEMLSKFCVLLNEKKAKVRELQMVVADSKNEGSSFSHFISTWIWEILERAVKAFRASLFPGNLQATFGSRVIYACRVSLTYYTAP
jgi:hypothetical protein